MYDIDIRSIILNIVSGPVQLHLSLNVSSHFNCNVDAIMIIYNIDNNLI